MSLTPDGVAASPNIHVTVRRDGTGEVAIDDAVYPIAEPTLQDARRAATELVLVRAAQRSGRSVRVHTRDPDGACTLTVHPDGTVNVEEDTATATAAPATTGDAARRQTADESAAEDKSDHAVAKDPPAAAESAFWPPGVAEESTWWSPRHASTGAGALPATEISPGPGGQGAAGTPEQPPEPSVAPAPAAVPVASARPTPPPAEPPPAAPAPREPAPASPAPPEPSPSTPATPGAVPTEAVPSRVEAPVAPGRHARKSFIATEDPVEPAQVGVRGSLARMGIRTGPSRQEQALRDDIRLVSQHWAGPRTVAVANPKGSANKTPTTVCLSAIFARYGGGPVLAWDNNETRGTAAWRTGKGPHQATVLDLLPKTQELLAVGAQAAELARYVHHQPADKYDVLWSDQSTEGEHEVTGDEVDAIHEVAAKYYRLVFMDSGNSERASNWRAMIRNGHSLVVPCTNVEDTAEAGARMLEALAQRDEHSAELARNAVAIISQRTPGNDPHMRRIVNDFAPLVRTVVTIPHDPAMYSGVIRFDALRPATQRAWLAAGAAVAEGL